MSSDEVNTFRMFPFLSKITFEFSFSSLSRGRGNMKFRINQKRDTDIMKMKIIIRNFFMIIKLGQSQVTK